MDQAAIAVSEGGAGSIKLTVMIRGKLTAMKVWEQEQYEKIRAESGDAAAEAYREGLGKSDFDGGCLVWVGVFLVVAFFLTRAGWWPKMLGLVAGLVGLVICGVGWRWAGHRSFLPHDDSEKR